MPYWLVNLGASYIALAFGGGRLPISNAKLKSELGWTRAFGRTARRWVPWATGRQVILVGGIDGQRPGRLKRAEICSPISVCVH
jgi:hypothetical protein